MTEDCGSNVGVLIVGSSQATSLYFGFDDLRINCSSFNTAGISLVKGNISMSDPYML